MKKEMVHKGIETRELLSGYGKKKLLTYADSFRELARSLECDFDWREEADRSNSLYQRKLWENRCLMAENLSEMAQIMSQVAGEVFCCRDFEEKKKRRVVQSLRAEGLEVEEICYVEQPGNRRSVGLALRSDRPEGCSTEEVAHMLSVLLNVRLRPASGSAYFVDSNPGYYTFVEEPRFAVLTGAARAVKETETVSGDNYSIVESEDGKLILLLSDGMGSGEKACADSDQVLDLMEKLLEAGYHYRAAVNLVNGSLVTMGEEQNMSTLDICELDLYEGSCEFCKVGASASFIKRAHMVEQISMGTLPLGIFRGVETETVKRSLMDGDYVIMVSDGVLEIMEEYGYGEDFGQVISRMELENPREVAQALLQYLIRRCRGNIRDDMTILVAGVWSAG